VLRIAGGAVLSAGAAEPLVGYDVRVPPGSLRKAWPSARRALYLLREDVAAPLSTDVLVWPSVRPAPFVPAAGLWPELAALRRAVGDAGWTVAVTRPGERTAELWWDTAPEAVDAAWTLLGYDVSDAALLSGLSNCGYDDERPRLQAAWAEHLNEHHLFRDATRADGFRAETDARVPEHAPFFVYGLYRVPAGVMG
jgi:hypothetical protein